MLLEEKDVDRMTDIIMNLCTKSFTITIQVLLLGKITGNSKISKFIEQKLDAS